VPAPLLLLVMVLHNHLLHLLARLLLLLNLLPILYLLECLSLLHGLPLLHLHLSLGSPL
jgi:hypothetical protein